MKNLSGTISSMPTPFNQAGELDLDTLTRELKYQSTSGITGVCVLGGTGEYSSLTSNERAEVVECAAAHRKETGGSLVVGLFASNEQEYHEAAAHAIKSGADALMLSPYAHYNFSARQFREALQRRARQTDAPLVVFNTVGRSGVRQSAEDLIALKKAVPSIIGIKDSSGDMSAVARVQEEIGNTCAILQGHDDLYLASRAIGCAGGIVAMAAIIPEDYAKLDAAIAKGDSDTAVQCHKKIMSFVQLIESEPMPVMIKAAMRLRGHDVGNTRTPLSAAPAEALAKLKERMASI